MNQSQVQTLTDIYNKAGGSIFPLIPSAVVSWATGTNGNNIANSVSNIVGDTEQFKGQTSALSGDPIILTGPSVSNTFINLNGTQQRVTQIQINTASEHVLTLENGQTVVVQDRILADSPATDTGKQQQLFVANQISQPSTNIYNVLLNTNSDPNSSTISVVASLNSKQADGTIVNSEIAKSALFGLQPNGGIVTNQFYAAGADTIYLTPSDAQLRENYNIAQKFGPPLDVSKDPNSQTSIINKMFQKKDIPRRDVSQMSVAKKTFNTKAFSGDDSQLFDYKKGANYTFKIGDVVLQIPPTHLTVTQLRSSYDIEMIGFHAMNTASPVSRITFKINTVFTGAKQIDGDLKRLITQFKYCPFNIIHSYDLTNILSTEDSLLQSVIGSNTASIPYVPVTMDEYTIYTIEGHPSSLGATFQFTLFNYLPYFDGDRSESFKYEKVNLDENKNVVVISDRAKVQQTVHLENAIHPYNFDIEYILADQDKKFFSKFQSEDVTEGQSTVDMFKVTSFQTNTMELLERTENGSKISLQCLGISCRYENKFAWIPIGNYSQALPQYIGPGVHTLSLNAKVNLDNSGTLGKLLKTYHELRALDYNQMYDDRYIVASSFTNFVDCNAVSICDVAITTLPNHPGYSDVNIMMRKSPYISHVTYSDKVAELDMYWGMQRIARLIETNNDLRQAVDNDLQASMANSMSELSWLYKWAVNSGQSTAVDGISVPFADLINAAAQTSYNLGGEKEKAAINNFRLYASTIDKVSNKLIQFLNKYSDLGAPKGLGWGGPVYGKGINVFISNITAELNNAYNQTVEYRTFIIDIIQTKELNNIYGFKSSEAKDQLYSALGGFTLPIDTKDNVTLFKINKAFNEQIKNGNIKAVFSSLNSTYDFIEKSIDELNDISQAQTVTYGLTNSKNNGFVVNYDNLKTSQEAVINVLKQMEEYIEGRNVSSITASVKTSNDIQSASLTISKQGTSSIQVQKATITKDAMSAKIAMQIGNQVAIRPPFSAHRFYPQCDSMVKLNPMLSVTIGSYFWNSLQYTNGSHVIRMIENFSRVIDNTISPMFDTVAWKNIFPPNTKSREWQQRAVNENDPFWLMQAITYPTSRKDFTYADEASNKGNNKSIPQGQITSPLINFKSTALAAWQGDTTADNIPFSGLSDWILMSKVNGSNVYGSATIDKIREKMYRKNIYTFDDVASGVRADTDSSTIYKNAFHLLNNSQGVVVNSSVMKRGETTVAALTSRQMGEDDEGLTSPIDVPNDLGRYQQQYIQAAKNPYAISPKTDTPATGSTPTSSATETNTQSSIVNKDAANIISALVLNTLLSAQAKKNSLYSYMQKVEPLAEYISKYIGAKILLGSAITNTSQLDLQNSIEAGVYSAANVFIQKYNNRWQWKAAGGNIANPSPYSNVISSSFNYYNTDSNYVVYGGPKYSITLSKSIYNSGGNVIQPTELSKATFEAVLLYLIIEELRAISSSTAAKNASLRIATNIGSNTSKLIAQDKDQRTINDSLLNLPYPDITCNKKSIKNTIDSVFNGINGNIKIGDSNTDSMNLSDVANLLLSSLNEYANQSGITDSLNSKDNLFINDTVAEDTKQCIVSKFMDSMLPTIGIQNAFPTYKMYIINENLSDLRFHSFDNWYDFRLVKDLMVIKSKEDPLHLLRARVVIDERFMILTDTFVQSDQERYPVEGKTPVPDLSLMNTPYDHNFYQGKVPLRAGMRICVKLGYHSDPRLLDTVFIGTITGLQGCMDKQIFELEALGDGRELSEPAVNSTVKISGLNYGEIITKLLRIHPSVVHFGRNYGTTLEQYTRDHYLVYGFARAVANGTLDKSLQGAVLNGTNKGTMSRWALPAMAVAGTVLFLPVMPLWGAALTAGSLSTGIYGGFNTYRNMQNSGLDKVVMENVEEKIQEQLTSFSSNGILNIKSTLNGNTFNLSKATGQIFKHFYEVNRYGHNPIDNNIWAVDIWGDHWTNIKALNDPSMEVTNIMSLWDVLTDIKRIYPNYALDIRPYGSRSTIFLGPRDWLIFRTDDPVLAMASQLEQTSNKQLLVQGKEYFKKLYNYDTFAEKGNNAFPSLTDFQRTHLASSESNIVYNGIQSTPQRGWNAVIVNGTGDKTVNISANAELNPSVVRTNSKKVPWIKSEVVLQQYALGFLKEGVEKMYGGTLVLRGNPKIEPYDRIYIADEITKMYGWIEVETVIHKFDNNFGFTSHITPNLVCSVNSDAYKTTSQLMRSMVSKYDVLSYLGNFSVGVLAGVVIGEGIAIIGGVLGTIATVAAISLFLYSGYNSFTESWQGVKRVLDENTGREDEKSQIAILHDMIVQTTNIHSYEYGANAGFALNWLVKGVNIPNKQAELKNISKGTWETLQTSFQKMWYSRSSINPFEIGRENVYSADLMKSIAEKINKVSKKQELGRKIDESKFGKALNSSDKNALSEAYALLDDEVKALKQQLKNKGMTEFDEAFKKIIGPLDDKLTKLSDTISKLQNPLTDGPLPEGAVKIKTKPVGDTVSPKLENLSKGTSRIIKSGMTLLFAQMLLDAVDAIPKYLESFCLLYATKANCINISPLWHRNNLMMAGLDGWQKTNAFLHMKNMVMYAKRAISNIDLSLNYASPTLNVLTPAAIKNQNTAQQTAIKRNSGTKGSSTTIAAANSIQKFKANIDASINKYKNSINEPCARDLLNETNLFAQWAKESASSGGLNQFAVSKGQAAGNYGFSQINVTQHLDEIRNYTGNQNLTYDQACNLLLTNPQLASDIGTQILVSAINSETSAAKAAGLTPCSNMNVSKMGLMTTYERALAAYNAGNGWRTQLSKPNSGTGKDEIKHINDYINGVKGYQPVYNQLLNTQKGAQLVNLLSPIDIDNIKNSDKILAKANALIGVQYIYGGKNPTTGIDCSGFSQQVYAAAGINLQGDANAQFNNPNLKAVAITDQLPVGALIFFKNTNPSKTGITHVAVYAGNGILINPSSSNGQIVSVSYQNYMQNAINKDQFAGIRVPK